MIVGCISFALLCALVHIWATAWEDFNSDRDDHCHNCPYGWCTDAPDPECKRWRVTDEDKNSESADNQRADNGDNKIL